MVVPGHMRLAAGDTPHQSVPCYERLALKLRRYDAHVKAGAAASRCVHHRLQRAGCMCVRGRPVRRQPRIAPHALHPRVRTRVLGPCSRTQR